MARFGEWSVVVVARVGQMGHDALCAMMLEDEVTYVAVNAALETEALAHIRLHVDEDGATGIRVCSRTRCGEVVHRPLGAA